MARKYLHPDKMMLLVVGNKEKFDSPLSNFGDVNVIELKPVEKTSPHIKG